MSEQEDARIPRVVFAGFASCFGCQINITNIEEHLLDVLGQVDMEYWQLTSSDPMPEDFDVAVIEGAITTKEAEATAKRLREIADVVITIGSCAQTAGIPGMSAAEYDTRAVDVYGEDVPAIIAESAYEPRAVDEVIDVDYVVSCCPVDPYEFVRTLHHVLHGSNIYHHTATLCGDCKQNERGCFYGRGIMCMGLVTRTGCGARCTNLGRECNGCAGLSPDANVDGARKIAVAAGIDEADFNKALEMFNENNDAIHAAKEKAEVA